MRYLFRISGLSIFLLLYLSFTCVSAYQSLEQPAVKVLRLASNLDSKHPVQQAFSFMNSALQSFSGGKMKLILYPSGQMGNVSDLIQQCQLGAMDMSKASASDLSSFDDVFSVFDLPYLFQNSNEFKRVIYGPVGREVMHSPIKNKGFFALAAYQGGYRSFYGKTPIRSPNDLKGLKVRVQSSQVTIKMIRCLGGAPALIPFGDTYTALDQGVIDAAENSIPSYVDTRHVEIAKYYSEDEHTSIPDFLIISTRVWNSLTVMEKEWLQKAAEVSEKFQNDLWDSIVNTKRKEAKKVGAHFIKVDKKLFENAVQPVYEEIKKDSRKAGLLRKIQELKT